MKIKLTESQYKRIFLDNQFLNEGKEIDYITPPDNYYDYDPQGGIGASRYASNLPVTGNYRMDNIKQLQRSNNCFGKRHDSTCNDRKKQKCIAAGGIPTNRTLKGKVWDELEKRGKWITVDGKRKYQTYGSGYNDNDDIKACYCDRSNLGTVKKVSRECRQIGDDGKWETITLIDTIYDKNWGQTYISQGPDNVYDPISKKYVKNMSDKEHQAYIERQHAKGARFQADLSTTVSSDNFFYKYRHEILDVLAIAALFIPVAGPFISGGIDLINAGVYAKEGQNGMAALMTAVAFIPGGMQAIKAIKGKGLQKGVTTTLDWAIKQGSKKVTKESIEKKLKQELGEKVFTKNEKILSRFFEKVVETGGKPGLQQEIKLMSELMEKTPAYYKNFLRNPAVVEKFLLKNEFNSYKAYLAYLRSVAGKEGKIALLIYSGIHEGVRTYQIAKEEIQRANLEADAAKGNISSIVRLAGYDWRTTKKIFGVTPYEENPQQNYDDNRLLKKAWNAGWRPYDKNDPENFNFPPEEFWTPKVKEALNKTDVDSEVQDVIDIVKDDNISDEEKKEKLEKIKVLDDFGKNKKGETTLSLDIDGVKTSVNTDSLNNVMNIGNFDKIEDYQKEWESLLNKKEDGK
jgi:hypothetical protein